MLFFGLDRFSTDLVFDLRSSAEGIDFERLCTLASKQLTLRDYAIKQNTYLVEGSYEYGEQQIKIEVSRRVFPQAITLHNFLGLTIPILASEYLLAHKLCAITSCKALQNRDIYDADFMFKKNWEPDVGIIELRTGQSLSEYYRSLLACLDTLSASNSILLGLGEVLDKEQREWARQNLAESFRQQLLLRL